MLTRRAVLNVACGQWFPVGQQRLFDSLEERQENATRLFWRDEYPPNSPTHEDAPYAFKPYAFQHARTLGFDQAIWLDASVWLHKKPLADIWARIDEDGWYLEPDGHVVGEWISDATLALFHLTRDEAMSLPLIDGKLIGLDFRNAKAAEWLDCWLALADSGAFNGAWTNDNGEVSTDPRCRGHRHDISCGSPLAADLGMSLQPFKRLGFPGNGEPGDEIIVLAAGM